jgi:alkylhydroperoxidase family enzyme
MLRSLVLKQLDAEERKLGGVSVEYLRHVARNSIPAFLKFALFTPLSRHRSRLPADAYHVARLVAVRAEDCGSCVQIELNLARKSGVAAGVLRAVLDDRPEDLAPPLADVYRFARAVASQADDPELREHLRARHGEQGLIDLAFAVAAARVFPTVKRALGYATSCEAGGWGLGDGG